MRAALVGDEGLAIDAGVIEADASRSRPGGVGVGQLEVERNSDPARNLVLQGEQIAGVAREPLCPKMRVGFGVDQLGSDANPASRPLDVSAQHITHTKLAADLLRVDRLVPVGESGVARDHEHVRDPRQIGRQIPGDPIGEILLFGVVTEVDKGQHND